MHDTFSDFPFFYYHLTPPSPHPTPQNVNKLSFTLHQHVGGEVS